MGDGGVFGRAGLPAHVCRALEVLGSSPLPPGSWLLLGPQHAVLAWNPLCLLPLLPREAEARTGTPTRQQRRLNQEVPKSTLDR